MKAILFFVVTAITMLSCNPPQGKFAEASVESFVGLKDNRPDLIIVDVRTPEEIAEGKIEGALEIDFLNPDFKTQINGLDKKKPIVLYCAVGGRSRDAMELMKNEGFKEVYNLAGGVSAWQMAGFSLTVHR